ncbi:Metallophosphoesterase domain-containing protein 1 [Seminavis robusta]|uniref:Metallophosphoesterase domain-containing protein 1 n=1 Tax=Seminavis robusta TaxID=568900 RepID=A0A9N8DT20_9STRA|nr:Metallophosphoesterase domain-containing protein 1 [Seminavis robusta]|eukprot:Sro230_g093460.1 Metallophosphoesterase domain-containing protein 1 (256) ;mRNA; r:76298-77065
MVVVSDTHGFEKDLGVLPQGDVLLHLGDFARDGPPWVKQNSLQLLDEWLAQQPHKHKIVLKGNHDPRAYKPFVQNPQALYATSVQSVTIEGFVLALVPFRYQSAKIGKKNKSKAKPLLLPEACHVVASHVPPKGILDTVCTNGKAAGCDVLRQQLVSSTTPPPLVLCGHIHESRGWEEHNFNAANDDSNTLVVNAANANHGRATKIVHGPVVVELTRQQQQDGKEHVQVELLQMEQQGLPESSKRWEQEAMWREQ